MFYLEPAQSSLKIEGRIDLRVLILDKFNLFFFFVLIQDSFFLASRRIYNLFTKWDKICRNAGWHLAKTAGAGCAYGKRILWRSRWDCFWVERGLKPPGTKPTAITLVITARAKTSDQQKEKNRARHTLEISTDAA